MDIKSRPTWGAGQRGNEWIFSGNYKSLLSPASLLTDGQDFQAWRQQRVLGRDLEDGETAP